MGGFASKPREEEGEAAAVAGMRKWGAHGVAVDSSTCLRAMAADVSLHV